MSRFCLLFQEMVKEREEERERLRKELQKSREQIHALHEAHRKGGQPLCVSCSQRTQPSQPAQDTGKSTSSIICH